MQGYRHRCGLLQQKLPAHHATRRKTRIRWPKPAARRRTMEVAMNEDIRGSIARYEAMVGLCDFADLDDPEQAGKDRALYGTEYGAKLDPGGKPMWSSARVLRFLVEVCGYSYQQALDGLINDIRSWPLTQAPPIAPKEHARTLRAGGGDIIELLFNLKVSRLAAEDPERAGFFRDTAKALIDMGIDRSM